MCTLCDKRGPALLRHVVVVVIERTPRDTGLRGEGVQFFE